MRTVEMVVRVPSGFVNANFDHYNRGPKGGLFSREVPNPFTKEGSVLI